ncbi:MAG: ABC transporter substrate-binding protein [Caldilineaceae bacterium]
MKSGIVIRTLLAFTALLLFACAAPTQPVEAPAADEGPPPTPTPIVAEYGEGDMQLIYWHGLTGSDGATMQQMVEAFVSANPDISVRVEAMPWNIYFDKLLTAMVSGSPPDVFIIHEFSSNGFARQNVLRNTSDLYTSGGGLLPDDDFKPELLERLNYEGTRYGVPLDNLGWGTWINRDLFEAADLDPDTPPANGAELLEMARQLTVDANGNNAASPDFDPENVAQWGIAINNPKNTFQSVLWQFGGDVFNESGEATLDTEEAKAALQYTTDLIYQEHVSPPPAGFDALQAFGAGQVAILPGGTWFLNFMKSSEINWDVWPMVQMGPVQGAARMSSHVLHMAPTLEGDRLEASKRLIYYLSDNGGTWAESGQVPARFSVQESLDPEADRAVLVFADAFKVIGRLETPHPLKLEIASAWEPEVGGAWDNVNPVDDALLTADERVQDVLDRFER